MVVCNYNSTLFWYDFTIVLLTKLQVKETSEFHVSRQAVSCP